MEQALRRTARTYRRGLWDDMDVHVEIWLEKEALADSALRRASNVACGYLLGVLTTYHPTLLELDAQTVEHLGPMDMPPLDTRCYPSAADAILAENLIVLRSQLIVTKTRRQCGWTGWQVKAAVCTRRF